MKIGIVTTGEMNMSECSSAARGVDYKSEDFKEIDMISEGTSYTSARNDVRQFCNRITICTLPICKLKKAVIENKMTIMANIYKRKLDEMKIMIEAADGHLQTIRKSTEVK